jgi:hypothetical protein
MTGCTKPRDGRDSMQDNTHPVSTSYCLAWTGAVFGFAHCDVFIDTLLQLAPQRVPFVQPSFG